MKTGAGFRSASAEELVLIESYLDEANSQALDYLWRWVHGSWYPDSGASAGLGHGLGHIQYFIQWLGTEGIKNNGE